MDFGETWWEKNCVWIVGLALAIIGALCVAAGLIWLPANWSGNHSNEFVKAVGDALLIAGALTIVVDPFLKRRLVKEASKGIFKHMLGFDHEPEIKDRLESIAFNTKLFRKDLRIVCNITDLADSTVRLDINQSWMVCNPTQRSLKYPPGLAFERAERPTDVVLKVMGAESFELRGCPQDPNELGVLRTERREAEVPPGESGLLVEATFSVTLPDDFYHVFSAGSPLIGASISVNAPAHLKIVTSSGWTEQQGSTWRYQKLFMPGEVITVRWFRP
jgi:hypothetical protein